MRRCDTKRALRHNLFRPEGNGEDVMENVGGRLLAPEAEGNGEDVLDRL